MATRKNNVGTKITDVPLPVGEILQNHLENSNEPLAVAYRKHQSEKAESEVLFNTHFPNTEICINLKLLTFKPGRMADGVELLGCLRRDSEDHLTFREMLMQSFLRPKSQRKVYPYPYDGELISFTQRDDMTFRSHFKDFAISPTLTEKEVRKLGNKLKREFVNALLGLVEKKEGAR